MSQSFSKQVINELRSELAGLEVNIARLRKIIDGRLQKDSGCSNVGDLTPREIDALIAEIVMGLTVVSRDWPCGSEPECGCYEAAIHINPDTGNALIGSWYDEKGPVLASHNERGWPPALDGSGDTFADVKPVPFYSTDPADSERLEERLLELDLTVTVWRAPGRPCSIKIGTPDGYGFVAEHESKEMALCLAAIEMACDHIKCPITGSLRVDCL